MNVICFISGSLPLLTCLDILYTNYTHTPQTSGKKVQRHLVTPSRRVVFCSLL